MVGIAASLCWLVAAMGMLEGGATGPVVVSSGGSVTVDGTIGAEEWKGATGVKVGANEYLLQIDGEHLCVAVRGVKQVILTVAIESDKGVRVLHASASLGEARYEKDGDGYKRAADFVWGCSDNSRASEEAKATEREKYLKEKGWLGATIGRGGHEPEMKIRLADMKGIKDRDGAAITVNVLSAFATGKEKGAAGDRWPEGVRDDTVAMGLRMGNAPEKAAFKVETWKRVMVGK